MDISILYMLAVVAFGLYIFSLVAFMTGYHNIITLGFTMVSTVAVWKLGNAFIDGTVSRIIETSGIAEVVREPTAASVFHWIAIIMFVGLIIQILSVFNENKVAGDW